MALVRLWNSAGASDSGFNAVAHIAEKKVFVAGDEDGCIHFFSGSTRYFKRKFHSFKTVGARYSPWVYQMMRSLQFVQEQMKQYLSLLEKSFIK